MKNIFASLQHHEFTNVSWEIVPQKKFKKYQDIIFHPTAGDQRKHVFLCTTVIIPAHWKLRVCYGEGTIAEENIMQEHMILFFLPPPMVVLLLTRWNSTPSSVGDPSQGGAPLWKMVLINWSHLVFVNFGAQLWSTWCYRRRNKKCRNANTQQTPVIRSSFENLKFTKMLRPAWIRSDGEHKLEDWQQSWHLKKNQDRCCSRWMRPKITIHPIHT